MSASSEDFLGSSTLVTAPSAATPGAEHSVKLSLRDKSGGWSEVVQKPKHTVSSCDSGWVGLKLCGPGGGEYCCKDDYTYTAMAKGEGIRPTRP